MTGGAAIVRIPAPSGCARQAVDVALGQVPLVVLTARMVAQLQRECGSDEKLAAWVLKLVTRRRRPLGVHDPEASRTWFWAPPDWTSEKLRGALEGLRGLGQGERRQVSPTAQGVRRAAARSRLHANAAVSERQADARLARNRAC